MYHFEKKRTPKTHQEAFGVSAEPILEDGFQNNSNS